MKCNFFIMGKKRYCKYKVLQCNKGMDICNFHYNFLKKNKKIALYKIAYLIRKNKNYFFTYIYYKKVLKNFFLKYCFRHKHQECSICLDTIYKNNAIKLKCNHIFHKECILKYLTLNQFKKKCPYCRQDVFFDSANFMRLQKCFIIRIPEIISKTYFHKSFVLKSLYRDDFFDYILNNFCHEVIIYLH